MSDLIVPGQTPNLSKELAKACSDLMTALMRDYPGLTPHLQPGFQIQVVNRTNCFFALHGNFLGAGFQGGLTQANGRKP